jgi:hypothetical protein
LLINHGSTDSGEQEQIIIAETLFIINVLEYH